ncbi:nitrite reductase small subunit NirD [Sunxiuqinia indica]|uniref:nitrite reductase small subunit NirD n=1 Tax=Sunxiuqinia indica TaxID=2692584 RepID=UPI00135B0357|nr:nitrite reductase small subunit NirD [Sunxiuqinia indica]
MEIKEQTEIKEWVKAAAVEDFPRNGGAAVLVNGEQIAVFNFTNEGRWFATQNQCPHKGEMAISRGLTGDSEGHPKVACPFHKKTFSLEDGKCLTDEEFQLKTFPVKIEEGYVLIGIE